MIVKPKIRSFVCITAHPTGCAAHIDEQIAIAKAANKTGEGPKNVLVIGASTGYGLSTRISAAFTYGAKTLGIFFERPSSNGKPASAGWYNSAAFENAAQAEGIYAKSFNGDAFSDEMKAQTIETIKADMGKVDLVIYSLASPRRTDPKDGVTYKSTLKPVGEPFHAKNLDTDKELISEISIEPANEQEIRDTTKVMGGEDWELWMDALLEADVLADSCKTVAYSYLGPEVTWPIYKKGTIGVAKDDLDRAVVAIREKMQSIGGDAIVSVNKAVVTQASSAIPVVPLYISILFKIMKAKGTHEDTIHQMVRLLTERLYSDQPYETDESGRIRIDDWEMDEDVQAEATRLFHEVNTENLAAIADFAGYQENFLKLFGFGIDGVDYDADVDVEVSIPSIS
ncbi:MAG: trans-2-enoyl-CoA reductase family protein [Opitutales bacterium]|nr:trans-2-enoyl-CoA reductase family protein [Opitutales bacterium]